jgi:hypothetical protein
LNALDAIELFSEPGESRALCDVDGERIEVELTPPDDASEDRVWLSVSQSTAEDDCVHTARLTPDQALRLGRWVVAAGQAARGG